MKIDVLENALSGINEKTLDNVLNERHKRMEKEETNAPVTATERKSLFSFKNCCGFGGDPMRTGDNYSPFNKESRNR